MTAPKRLYIVVFFAAILSLGSRALAEGTVTVISSTPSANSKLTSEPTADGTPVVHKSLHKKKKTVVAATTPTPTPTPTPTDTTTAAVPAPTTPTYPLIPPTPPSVGAAPTTILQAKSTPVIVTPVVIDQPAQVTANAGSIHIGTATQTPAVSVVVGPTVETGLPIGRYPGMGTPIKGVSTFVPAPVTVPATMNHTPLFATVPGGVPALGSAVTGMYSSHSSAAPDDFVFTNFSKKYKNTYPWKTNIITTEFWIGEGSTPISSTTNEASAWDLDWRSSNSGSDSPNNRNGYASGGHASTVNPFYVALPFNDLAFPDLARQWLPRGWYRHPRDGKQVSACQDRWVEIKNGQGDVCYAQWEDVGPLNYEDAEYVFGDTRPIGLGENHAGLDVSPAVAEYLNVTDRNRTTSWRFVDDEDVRPGAWLKLDEQAVLYQALHQLKNFHSTTITPIQRTNEPIDDPESIDANKKKVDASKG
jgi:hypothetical protein